MIVRAVFTSFVFLGVAAAQESRGSITGKVTDPQGAVIPAAAVTVTNIETNAASKTATNETGYFEINLLNPGSYTLSVEAAGFKKSVRTGLVLNVAGRLDIETQLQMGQLAETVEVTAAAPLLDTTTASGGRVIDNRQIMQLPFADLNPFALSALTPGMMWTGQPEYNRPFDNGGTSSFNTMGGVGQNEYTIDGAPATGTGRRVAFVPPSDAVEEFKLETATFDASYGHTSGATINVMTKAGTNAYHGSLYEQHWQQRWNATSHFTRLAWERDVREGRRKSTDPKQAPGRSNQFGATLGGPVRLPKVYNGRDRFFFFFSYNGIYQKKAETTGSINRSVPKMAWRQGDFSDLQAIDAVKYTVYDPRSARLESGHVVRTPFPGNKGIPVLNPVYKFYEKLYPAPNDVPGLVSPEGANNYYALAMPKDERFNSLVNRYDYNLSETKRIFGRWYWNHRLADEYDWTYETARGLHTNGLTRINKAGGGDYIWTINAANTLDVGASWMRFADGSVRPAQAKYKPSDVGLPKYLDEKAGDYHALPRINFNNIESIGDSYPFIGNRGTTAELKAAMNTLRGNHSLKYGWQERRYWYPTGSPGDSSGSFSFSNSYTRQADNTNTASNRGLEWAAFMMGLANSTSISTNDSAYWATRFRALYVQDDWRLSRRLRLNLGLRYEREGGTTERFNRGLAGGFGFDYTPPFADAVRAAYAKNPLPELAPDKLVLRGAAYYLGQPYKTFTNGTHHLLPRAGLVYQLTSKMVLRGGYGWYYDTYNVMNDRPSQDGYSQGTSTIITSDQGLTFCCGLGSIASLSASRNVMTDPFPIRADGTRFEVPYGNSLGPSRRQGRGFDFIPRDFSPAWQQRWRLGVQREITRDMVVEVSYDGALSKYFVAQTISYLPQQYWATGNVRNQAVDDNLQTNLPHPFNLKNFPQLQQTDPLLYKYWSTVGFFNSTNIRKNSLLRAYPNINGLTGLRPGVSFKDSRGSNRYSDVQFQFERRFSHGIQSSVMYTWARALDHDYYLNEFDPQFGPPRISNDTRPHRFVWTSIYELPFGKGRTWLTSHPLQHVAGGWQLSWIYQYQAGSNVTFGNRFFYGDLSKLQELLKHDEVHSKDIHMWFDPGIAYISGTGPIPASFVGFEGRTAFQPGSYHVRVFPTDLEVLRSDGIRKWDVKIQRDFRFAERAKVRFAVDLLNATNHTNFEGPNTDPTSRNFGRITTQRGLSRLIQFNLRIDF